MDGSKKKINLAPQPYHRTLESIQTLFKSKRIGDPLSGSGSPIRLDLNNV